MRRTGTGLLEVRDFLQVKLDLWLPVQKSSTSVRQRLGRCWHPAKAATGCEQNGSNLTQLRHKLQPWYLLPTSLHLLPSPTSPSAAQVHSQCRGNGQWSELSVAATCVTSSRSRVRTVTHQGSVVWRQWTLNKWTVVNPQREHLGKSYVQRSQPSFLGVEDRRRPSKSLVSNLRTYGSRLVIIGPWFQ